MENLNRNKIQGWSTALWVGIMTLVIFGSGGYLIIRYLQNQSFRTIWNFGEPHIIQVAVGLLTGLTGAGLALFIIHRNFFKTEKEYYYRLIGNWNLNYTVIIFLSLCAGIGEEVFFRAGLQPFLGIWPTAFFFILIHGYLNPRNWRISIYGLFMVILFGGIGYLFEKVGLLCVITAHAVIDFILFIDMKKERHDHEQNPSPEDPDLRFTS